MARVPLLSPDAATPEQKAAWDEVFASHAVTNMKATLAHSPAALKAVLEWYTLFGRVKAYLSEREAVLFCNAISRANHCVLCSLSMRRAIVSWGEDPAALVLDDRASALVDFGRALAVDANGVDDALFARLKAHFDDVQIVELTTFGALMIVNNVFNSALKIDVDTALDPYRVEPEVLFA